MSKKGDGLPSYDEIAGASSSPSVGRGQQLLNQLALTRAQHVSSVVDEQVFPLLDQQALYGISKTTVALMPSNISIPEESSSSSEFSFESTVTKVELVGFPSDESVHQIRLCGPMNRLEFWRQSGVIAELQNVLEDRLSTSPHFDFSKEEVEMLDAPAPEPSLPARPEKKGFWGRKSSTAAETAGKKDWVHESSGFDRAEVQKQGGVTIDVRLEEISLRTVSDFGLYETINRQAVMIRVDAGS